MASQPKRPSASAKQAIIELVNFKMEGGTCIHTDVAYRVIEGGHEENYFLRCAGEVRPWVVNLLKVHEQHSMVSVDGPQPGELGGRPLYFHPAEVFPAFYADFTEFNPLQLNRKFYVKRPMLFYSVDPVARRTNKAYADAEVLFCETVLRHNEHPNIVKYHGCIVADGRVAGLVFDRLALSKYSMTLQRRCEEKGTPLNVDNIVGQVRAALNHLRTNLYVRDKEGDPIQVAYCHNDVHTRNIMVIKDGDREVAVLIGFDCCALAGAQFVLNGIVKTSSVDNDWRRLKQVEDKLRTAFPCTDHAPSDVDMSRV